MNFEIYKFDSVTSTNDMAMELIENKKKEEGFVYADKQTKGRGTRGKIWISEKGNFFGTIFFQLKKKYPPFNEFSIINPVIISEVIKNFSKKKIRFKWPNDVFLNKKKVCGILQETIVSKEKKFLIIGIGINLVSSPNIENHYLATNIFAETRKKPTTKEIIDLLIGSYENFFYNLNEYNFMYFKQKIELMSLK